MRACLAEDARPPLSLAVAGNHWLPDRRCSASMNGAAESRIFLLLLFCVASEQPPSAESGGMRAKRHRCLRAGARCSSSVACELPLTHLSGRWDQDVDTQPGVS